MKDMCRSEIEHSEEGIPDIVVIVGLEEEWIQSGGMRKGLGKYEMFEQSKQIYICWS